MNHKLVIWVDEDFAERLLELGHAVYRIDTQAEVGDAVVVPHPAPLPDLILSRRAHYWDESFFSKRSYLDNALKSARGKQRERKKREQACQTTKPKSSARRSSRRRSSSSPPSEGSPS